jgi:hypothetical protein
MSTFSIKKVISFDSRNQDKLDEVKTNLANANLALSSARAEETAIGSRLRGATERSTQKRNKLQTFYGYLQDGILATQALTSAFEGANRACIQCKVVYDANLRLFAKLNQTANDAALTAYQVDDFAQKVQNVIAKNKIISQSIVSDYSRASTNARTALDIVLQALKDAAAAVDSAKLALDTSIKIRDDLSQILCLFYAEKFTGDFNADLKAASSFSFKERSVGQIYYSYSEIMHDLTTLLKKFGLLHILDSRTNVAYEEAVSARERKDDLEVSLREAEAYSKRSAESVAAHTSALAAIKTVLGLK